jgi:hypothetical protein
MVFRHGGTKYNQGDIVKVSLLFHLLLFLFTSVSLSAAPGDLDLSFAGTGTKRMGFGGGNDQAHAVTVQPDGKLIMAGA